MHVTDDSFVQFTFPFRFEVEDYDALLEQIGQGVDSSDWQSVAIDTSDLLSDALCRQLYRQGTEGMVTCWEMHSVALHAWRGFNATWLLQSESSKTIGFQFGSVKLHLFPTGYGFLVFEVSAATSDFGEWLDLIHFFRFSDGERGVILKGKRDLSKADPNKALAFSFEGTLATRISIMLSSIMDREGWWSETFVRHRLVPFYCISVDESDDQDAHLHLYQLRNQFTSRTHMHPSTTDLSSDHPGCRPYAKNQWFVYSLEGGGFHSRNRPDHSFFTETHSSHVRRQYTMLFLLTLHQRFHLHQLTRDAALNWAKNGTRKTRSAIDTLLEADLWHTTNYQFSQIAYSDHLQNFYAKWQEVFRIRERSVELKQKLQEMHAYLQRDEARRIENKINAYSTLIGLPSLAASLMALNVVGVTATTGLSPAFVLNTLIGSVAIGIFAFYVWLRG